jgi:hypothetical protein
VRFVELGAERLVQIELDALPVFADEVPEVARDVDAAAGELLLEARADRALVTARFDASVDAGDLVSTAASECPAAGRRTL